MSAHRTFKKTIKDITKTIPYDLSSGIDLSCQDIIDVSNIYFCNTTALLSDDSKFGGVGYPGLPADTYSVITCSGQLDMSCNNILDVSRIYFCGRLGAGSNWIGQGNSFDISCTENIKIITAPDASIGFYQGSTAEMQIDSNHIGISGGSLDTPAINFGLTSANDNNTGIYHHRDKSIGFSTDGNIGMIIDDVSNLVIRPGTESIPGLNFALSFLGHGTGMWSSGANFINFSTNATERMEISDNAVSIGKPSSTPIALQRLSSNIDATWEDGNCGNSKYIYFTPSDFFLQNVNPGRPLDYVGISAESIEQLNTSPFVLDTSGVSNFVAIKLIPKGFKINDIAEAGQLYSRSNPAIDSWWVYEQVIDASLSAIKSFMGTSTLPFGVDGTSNIDLTGGSSTISTGNLCCVVYVQCFPGGVQLNADNGITGARIGIVRA